MRRIEKIGSFLILFLFILTGILFSEEMFTTDENYILKNGEPFLIKGVVYVPVYPGYLPWDLVKKTDLPDKLKSSIRNDVFSIREMGANTIRLWDAPPFCYEAIKQSGGLFFIQTIWFPVDADDLQDPVFKSACKKTIVETIDRIYSVYSSQKPPPVIAFLVGNEISERTIEDTDEKHTGITSYTGDFVNAPEGSTPSECFLAEMADYVKKYEKENYGRYHLVSYANEIRTQDIIDTPFLDFRSYNAYPYAIRDYLSSEYKSTTKSGFRAWIEYLKKKHIKKPLLVTETGLSISPEAMHIGGPYYGYGGNTEQEQAQYLVTSWNDVLNADPPVAGMCVHEYLDAWWKFDLKDSFEHNRDDVEEWFGIVSIEKKKKWYETSPRKAYKELKSKWIE